MENNNENKAKFFALYYGQKIIRWNQWHDETENGLVIFKQPMSSPTGIDKGWYLELKPLSSITDEDAIEVAKIEDYEPSGKIVRRDYYGTPMVQVLMEEDEYSPTATINITATGYIYWDNNECYEDSQQSVVNASAYDYLRSKDYALPYMGLSVEQLIEYGWVKLKTQ